MNNKFNSKVEELIAQGVSPARIIKETGCSRSAVYYHKRKLKGQTTHFGAAKSVQFELEENQTTHPSVELIPAITSAPISQTLNQYSGTPIFRKIKEFNETQPPEQRVSYEILAQNGLLKCILTGKTMNPLGNSNGFTLMEERGFVFFVKNEFAEMIKEEGLGAAQKKFAAN